MLPDDVLLEVFDFYVDQTWGGDEKKEIEAWQRLVHACRRWRSVVFGSPRRLNLRLVCRANTRARDTVDIWPALPLLIRHYNCTGGVDNIVAPLERSDVVHRINEINLWQLSSSQLEDIWEAIQVPFPELTHLLLHHRFDETEPVLPLSDSFSAPRLRSVNLQRIPYPDLPKLLLSATHLTRLHLHHIPDSGYIPPGAMAACLSTLTSLKQLYLEFRFPRPLPDQESQLPPPSIRTSLPILDRFTFRGGGEYLEVLVAGVDAPQIRRLDITFFNDIVFVTPQLTRFISRTPTFEAFHEARVTTLKDSTASVELLSAYARLNVSISCEELDWQLSFLEQICTSSLPPLSTLQNLYMMPGRRWPQDWKDNIDYAQWLELLRSFSAVKNLYLSKELAPCVVHALHDLVGGRTTEVFPNLQNVFLRGPQGSGPVQEGIWKFFAAARQVTGHPIRVSRWHR
jgi:hypothetical protein